jgi:hypothetical protein
MHARCLADAGHLLRTGTSSSRSATGDVLIEIARSVTLTLLGTAVQALKHGEIYEVAPSIGRVLVGDGWAVEVITERRVIPERVVKPNDPPSGDTSGS